MHDAKRLLDWSDRPLAMSMLGLNSGVTPLTAVPQNARPQNWHCAAPDAAWKALRAVIPGSSESEPDFAVVSVDAPRPYHPGTAELVIEISVSSLPRDVRVKPRIYAQAGVPLYWVIDIEGRRAIVHSDPRPDRYASVDMLGPDGELEAPHIGLPGISIAELLAAAGV